MKLADLVRTVLGLVPGGGVAGAIANVGTAAAAMAAIAGPVALVFHERETVLTTITVGQAALFGPLVFGLLWAVIALARRAPTP